MAMTTIPWQEMTWLNPPERGEVVDGRLEVVTRPMTDFWRTTSYGFVHDDGHFLGAALDGEAALEVTFTGAFSEQFDQAGLMLRAGPDLWIKAGVELSDGVLFASAVVTLGHSDWAVAPLPAGSAHLPITIRASRTGDGVTIRYRVGDAASWQLLRVAFVPPDAELLAGPMCCSPTRGGLVVRFEPVRVGPPDAQLHDA
jgi:regulation of enolase protein 1 (concanavalin A-like superfamily)